MPNDPDDFKNNNGANNGSNNGTDNSDNKDDFVDSSFLVQFKPGDKTESVADKLKESKAQAEKKEDSFGFKDEFDDFEFDSSISAFKPLKAEEPASPAVDVKPAEAKPADVKPVDAKPADVKPADVKPAEVKPAAVSSEPAFPKDGGTFDKPAFAPKAPEPSKESLPKFNDKDTGSKSSQPGSDKLFASGSGLDFATSEHDKKTSPFLNAEKPDIPAPDRVDIPRAETPKAAEPAQKQKPVAPANNGQAQPTGYRPYPSATKGEMFAKPKQEDEVTDKKDSAPAAAPVAPAKPAEPVKAAANVAPVKPAEPAKSSAPAAPVKAEPAKTAATAAAVGAAAATAASVTKAAAPAQAKPAAPAAPANMPVQPKPATPVQPKPASQNQPKPASPAGTAPAASAPTKPATPATAAPAASVKPAQPQPKPVEKVKAPAETEKPQRPAASATNAAPTAKSAPAPAPAPVKPADQVRPGASAAKPEVYSPFEPKSKQPAAATRGVTNQAKHHDSSKNISPVTTVKKTKKHKKEPKSAKDPGLVGLITFLAIIIVAIGVLWALDNTSGIRALFGKKQVETIATVTSEKPIESSKEGVTATTTTEETTATTTTEATTESTTEATTTTTTEETTEATTTTTTEATTEATTTTTTEATTRRTTATSANETAAGSSINDFDMKINNFAPTAGGFKFDISLKNKSNYTANLPKSLKCLNIKLYSSSTITSVTSDSMVFTGDGVSYKGIPNEIAVSAGETYTFTVYVSTESSVTAYGYNYAYFDWYK